MFFTSNVYIPSISQSFLLVAPDLFVKEGLKIIEIVRSRRLKFMFDFMTIENQTNDMDINNIIFVISFQVR